MKKTVLVLFLAGLGALCQSLPRAKAGIGVVTGIRGEATVRRDPAPQPQAGKAWWQWLLMYEATVRRDPAPQPQALKFKDELFWLDTLSTGADSRLRLFILEQSVITMKEHSQLQLREEAPTATQPKRKNVINLLSGAARAVVEKDALKDTDYEIRTARAIAGIRGSDVIGVVGTAMNDRLQGAGLPRVPNNDCVAFLTGPASRSGVTDVKAGRTDMDQLDLLIACDQFTHQPISEEQFNRLSNFLPGSQNADHTPGTEGGGGGGGGGNPYSPTQGIFLGGSRPGTSGGGEK